MVQQSAQMTFTILIEGPLTITTPTVPPGVVGQVYTAVTFTATGGNPPYTWSAVSGLPPGLTLSSTGVLSGTPTAAGSYNPIIKVIDTAQ